MVSYTKETPLSQAHAFSVTVTACLAMPDCRWIHAVPSASSTPVCRRTLGLSCPLIQVQMYMTLCTAIRFGPNQGGHGKLLAVARCPCHGVPQLPCQMHRKMPCWTSRVWPSHMAPFVQACRRAGVQALPVYTDTGEPLGHAAAPPPCHPPVMLPHRTPMHQRGKVQRNCSRAQSLSSLAQHKGSLSRLPPAHRQSSATYRSGRRKLRDHQHWCKSKSGGRGATAGQ